MDPTLIYNNYHLQRRKIFQHNPRSNLYSTVDFTWRQSVSDKMTPRQLIEYKRSLEKQQIGDRSNELIAKRLRKEVNLSEEGVKYKTIDRIKSGKGSEMSMDNRGMRDSLNQELENYVNMQKSQSLNKRQQQKASGRLLNINQTNKHQNRQHQNTYKKYFDPQLQSITSRQSLAQSQLSSLTSKDNYLSNYLSKRLNKYLSPNSNNMHGSRQAGLYQLEKELQMFDKEKE